MTNKKTMALQTNNRSPFTQAITKAAKIKFNQVSGNMREVAIRHDLSVPRSGIILEKLIDKFADKLTFEDFFPDLFTGNELKQK